MHMISETIKYIGVDDLDIDLFESQYVVPEGMSYNSYLIDDEKIAVLDTADRRKGEQWKANLTAALNDRQQDYRARPLGTHRLDAGDVSWRAAGMQRTGCEDAG